MTIGIYEPADAVYVRYDHRAPQVAALLTQMIQEQEPGIMIDHVGSTSIPGCGGKGIIDLAVTYKTGSLEAAKSALDNIGFQRQTGRDPFPETRPMRVGCISALDGIFRIHAHVIERNGEEHKGLLAFRNTLRADANLRAAYEQRKQQILSSGITDSLDYCEAKGAFITTTLDRLKSLSHQN